MAAASIISTEGKARIPYMKNWKQIAVANGFGIPEADLDAIVPVLESLDAAFGKIATSFPADTDSAQIFEASVEAK